MPINLTVNGRSHTDDATRAMGRMALEDCLAVLRGEEPLHRIV